MDKYIQTLQHLSWQELIRQLHTILSQDTITLEKNVSYYKKLLATPNPDRDQLNRLFQKLQLDKLRNTTITELFFRLDQDNYKFIIMALESCIQQETQLQNKTPKDWVATIRSEHQNIKVYFMPLSYYQ